MASGGSWDGAREEEGEVEMAELERLRLCLRG